MGSPESTPSSASQPDAVAARLLLLARGTMEGLSTGLHRSPHKGASITFKQHRPYVPGDEIRRLDWKAFARSDRFYIREYEQETNLQAMLLVDVSTSMQYRGDRAPGSKADYARSLAASIGMLLLQQQDAVGLATFDSKLRDFLPARSTPNHLQLLAEALAKTGPPAETSLSATLQQLSPRLPRRALILLISDCLDDLPSLFKALSLLRHRQHEVVIFHLLDRDELDFPFHGWNRFESLERPSEFQNLDAATMRKTYLENLEVFLTELSRGCQKQRIDLARAVTDEPCSLVLSRYLASREGRPGSSKPLRAP